MSNLVKSIFAVIVIILVIVGFWYYGAKPITTTETGPIKIGAMLVLSGDAAAWGQASQRGIELAVKEANATGGISGRQIQMVYEDTQGDAKKAIAAYDKLTQIDKVNAIIGPDFQVEISALAPIIAKDNFPVIAPSYAPAANRSNPRNPLLIWLDAQTEAEAMAQYVYGKGIKTVSVIGTQDSWEKEVSESFANKFESLGGKVLSKELLPVDENETNTTITKTLAGKPQAVFLGTYYQFLNLTKKIKEAGYKGKLYSIEVDEYLANESKGYTTGLQFISSDLYQGDFRQEFEQTYNTKSNIPAGQSYDAAKILFSLIKENGIDNLVSAFKNFKEYNGASGKITVTSDNKTLLPMAIYQLNNGVIEKLSPQ